MNSATRTATQANGLRSAAPGDPARSGRGFTLVDVLVTLGVVSALIAIMFPALDSVRSTSRRVACASGMRQIGLAIQMYADDHNGFIPDTRLVPQGRDDEHRFNAPQWTTMIRFERSMSAVQVQAGDWDGIGLLHGEHYMDAPPIFYCPSHAGDVRFEAFAGAFKSDPAEVRVNYHYRGAPSPLWARLDLIPMGSALVADALADAPLRNHDDGFNVLHAGQSVGWFSDADGEVAALLGGGRSLGKDEKPITDPSEQIRLAWRMLEGESLE